MEKKIICVDFDGVIHSYERGWQNGEIYGTSTPGFFAWAVKAMEYFRLVVYSSRSKTPEGIAAMREAIGKWSINAIENGEVPRDFDWGGFFPYLDFSDVKPPAFLTIDDRAVRFMGSWRALDPAELTQFQPWNVFQNSSNTAFANDWNRMIGAISDFAAKWDLPCPDLIYHPKVLSKLRQASEQHISGTLINRGVRVRFGFFEQAEMLRPI